MGQKEVEATRTSLLRVQNYDPDGLARTADLGTALNFSEVVPDARRIIELYRRLPESILEDLTPQHLSMIQQAADADFNRFKQVEGFDPEETGNASEQRRQIVAGFKSGYDQTFNSIWTFIAYGVAKVTDSSALETRARAAFQQISDQNSSAKAAMTQFEADAQKILENIKAVAAEQGVSQQAEFFKRQADDHGKSAVEWDKKIKWRAGYVGAFAVLSLFIHKLPWMAPTTPYETAQLITSKLLIFGVLSYMLILAAKNYISDRHNVVVNRHRQTALQTYRVLADAAKDQGAQDIIVAQAAACIFAPQDTGFSRAGAETISGSKSVLELLTKAQPKAE